MPVRVAVMAAGFAALAFAPVPAMARESGTGRMAEKLSDPELQHALAGAMAALSDTMLDMKLAPLARAVEAMGDRRAARQLGSDATLRDIAGPEAGNMSREMRRKVPQMMGAMGAMAGAMEEMMPQLEAMGKRMADTMGKSDDLTDDAEDQIPAREATDE